MLENLYTTKMSANKKTLQNRFTKIRRKSGRISKIMAAQYHRKGWLFLTLLYRVRAVTRTV